MPSHVADALRTIKFSHNDGFGRSRRANRLFNFLSQRSTHCSAIPSHEGGDERVTPVFATIDDIRLNT